MDPLPVAAAVERPRIRVPRLSEGSFSEGDTRRAGVLRRGVTQNNRNHHALVRTRRRIGDLRRQRQRWTRRLWLCGGGRGRGRGGAFTTGAVGGRGTAAFFAGGRRGSPPPFCFAGALGSAASGIGACPSAGSTIGGGASGWGTRR